MPTDRPDAAPDRPVPPPAPAPPREDWRRLPAYGDAETTGPCPNCGAPMHTIRGSRSAVCGNCGFKDSCCF